MVSLKLNDDTVLSIELHEKRARLVVYKRGVENVCRIESIKNIIGFVESNNQQLFKGRLRLHKASGSIDVEVKGKLEGNIAACDLMTCLNAVKNGNFE
jgi:hypothetical protein